MHNSNFAKSRLLKNAKKHLITLTSLLFISSITFLKAQTIVTFDDKGWANSQDITTLIKSVDGVSFRFFTGGVEQSFGGNGIFFDVDNGIGDSGAIFPGFFANSGLSMAKLDAGSFDLQSFYFEGGFGNNAGLTITAYKNNISVGTAQVVSSVGAGVGVTVNLNSNFDDVDSVYITDSGGAFGFDGLFDHFTFSSVIATPVSASITAQTNVLCGGESTGALTVTAADGTSPYTYDWSNGASSISISSLLAGTYTVTVTDGGGGTATASATITEIAAIVVTLGTPVDVDCFGASTGSLTASVSGGTTPYTYNWNSGETSSMITNKPAGTYTVYVQDANGCGDAPPP